MTSRKPRAVRTQEILAAGLILAEQVGYNKVTRDNLAVAANMSQGAVNLHFGTMTQFQRAVMRAAIHQGNLRVLAQGLALKHPVALDAPEALRHQAADLLKG